MIADINASEINAPAVLEVGLDKPLMRSSPLVPNPPSSRKGFMAETVKVCGRAKSTVLDIGFDLERR